MTIWIHPRVRCPVCQAAPGRPCVEGELVMAGYHVARQMADARANVLRAAEEMGR